MMYPFVPYNFQNMYNLQQRLILLKCISKQSSACLVLFNVRRCWEGVSLQRYIFYCMVETCLAFPCVKTTDGQHSIVLCVCRCRVDVIPIQCHLCHLKEICMFKLPLGIVCTIIFYLPFHTDLCVKVSFDGNFLSASRLHLYLHSTQISTDQDIFVSALLQTPIKYVFCTPRIHEARPDQFEEVLFTSMASAICKHLDANQLKIREIRHAASAFSQILGRMARGIWRIWEAF